MYDITALGEILIDFTPATSMDGKTVFEQNPGGAPANLLAVVSRYGGKTAMIGKVGQDMFGDFLIETLHQNGIDARGVLVDSEHNTTLAFVALDSFGDRHFSFYRRFGADVFLKKEDVDTELIKHSKIFHFGSLSLTNEPAKSATDFALSVAKQANCIITFDPNYRELLWKDKETAVSVIKDYVKQADVIKFSKEEIEMITGINDVELAIRSVLDQGVKIVLVTDGANGVRYATDQFYGFVPSIRVKPIDTTGAGDIFFGTFLYELTREPIDFSSIAQIRMENAVRIAVKASGISTTKKGAIPSIPKYEEIISL